MGGRVEKRRIRLADISWGGGKPFARRRGESLADVRKRLLARDGLLARGPRRVAAIGRAIARGQVLPPVFVFNKDGELWLDDGCHRCTEATIRGARTISAVLIPVSSRQEDRHISPLLFDLEEAGVSWQDRVRLVEALVT